VLKWPLIGRKQVSAIAGVISSVSLFKFIYLGAG